MKEATARIELSNGFVLYAEGLTDDEARRIMHAIPSGTRITKHRPAPAPAPAPGKRPRKLGATVVRPSS